MRCGVPKSFGDLANLYDTETLANLYDISGKGRLADRGCSSRLPLFADLGLSSEALARHPKRAAHLESGIGLMLNEQKRARQTKRQGDKDA